MPTPADEHLLNVLDDWFASRLAKRLTGTTPVVPVTTPAVRTRDHKPIHQKLLAKAPSHGQPVAVRVLIRAAGYKVNSWSRDAVADLCSWGDLARHSRNVGVSLPVAHPA